MQSTASKHIATLEKRLGAQLVRRTSRGLALTSAGQRYYDDTRRLIDEFEALDEAMNEDERSPAGLIRVASPPGFADACLLPKLGPFFSRYPKLAIDFTVSQSLVNLVEDHVDVAIRLGPLEDSELRSRQVGTTTNIVVAAQSYLEAKGEPGTPAALAQHACIASIRGGTVRPWQFFKAESRVLVQPKGPIQSDNAELTRSAVKSGLGLAYAASWLFREELQSGAVRQVLADYDCIQVPISAVWSGDRILPARVAAFIDFLASACAEEQTLRRR